MIFRAASEQGRHRSISQLCKIFGISRASYYRWRACKPCPRKIEDRKFTEQIREIYAASGGRYGAPRIFEVLKQQGVRISKKRVARLMQQASLKGVSKKKLPRQGQVPEIESFTDNLKREFSVSEPNKVWVTDITYIKTADGWLYAAPVIDLFSRKVVGLALSAKQDKHLVSKALGMALAERKPQAGLVIHSDHGGVYRSKMIAELYNAHHIKGSMGAVAAPGDNAVAESFMSTLKAELIKDLGIIARDTCAQEVFLYTMGFYNNSRLHSTLGYLSPAGFEKIYWETQKGKETAA